MHTQQQQGVEVGVVMVLGVLGVVVEGLVWHLGVHSQQQQQRRRRRGTAVMTTGTLRMLGTPPSSSSSSSRGSGSSGSSRLGSPQGGAMLGQAHLVAQQQQRVAATVVLLGRLHCISSLHTRGLVDSLKPFGHQPCILNACLGCWMAWYSTVLGHLGFRDGGGTPPLGVCCMADCSLFVQSAQLVLLAAEMQELQRPSYVYAAWQSHNRRWELGDLTVPSLVQMEHRERQRWLDT
jgi:hypothetical protein